MKTKPLLLHIGYHKTATTWMQRKLFDPKYGYRQILDHEEVWKHIAGPHRLMFDHAHAKRMIDKKLEFVNADEIPVISSEILSGHPFLGGRESFDFANRLVQIYPDAKILISIRNQMNILPSVYMQYVLRGGTMHHEMFFSGTSSPGYVGFDPSHFQYHRLVHLYQNLFGSNAVHIITQESLRNELELALSKLAQFSGNTIYRSMNPEDTRPSGESYPEYSVGVLRRINHVQSSTLNQRPIFALGRTPYGLYKLSGYALKQPAVARLIKHKFPVRSYVKRNFEGFFAESNRRLIECVGDKVEIKGYDGFT